jgi:hypothetical protein
MACGRQDAGPTHVMRPHADLDRVANSQVDAGDTGVGTAAHNHARGERRNEWQEEVGMWAHSC